MARPSPNIIVTIYYIMLNYQTKGYELRQSYLLVTVLL